MIFSPTWWRKRRERRQEQHQLLRARRRVEELLRVRKRLEEGLRLFHAGLRIRAIPSLESVLKDPFFVPSFRMSAAALLGETYRGLAEFVQAEQYYTLAISESKSIPQDERRHNEWYMHYRPRCGLGLVMVMRRNLSSNHDGIRELLVGLREQFSSFPLKNLSAQINALEGLYCRQRGDLATAEDLLTEAQSELKGADAPFLLLWPDHIEALLLQLYTLIPAARVRVGINGRRLLRAGDAGTWSKAVAVACLLHLQVNRLLPDVDDAVEFESTVAEMDERDEHPEALLATLHELVQEEGDPLLTTEAAVLQLVWDSAIGRTTQMDAILADLATGIDSVPLGLCLLRAFEVSTIFDAFAAPGTPPAPALCTLRERGLAALDRLQDSLESYGYRASVRHLWRQCIEPERNASGHRQLDWLGEQFALLRQVTWP